jgi:hypothetical protein
MTSSYETCRGNATQDKRKGRRAAMTAFDDWEIEIAPASFYKLRHQRRDGRDTVFMPDNEPRRKEDVKDSFCLSSAPERINDPQSLIDQ